MKMPSVENYLQYIDKNAYIKSVFFHLSDIDGRIVNIIILVNNYLNIEGRFIHNTYYTKNNHKRILITVYPNIHIVNELAYHDTWEDTKFDLLEINLKPNDSILGLYHKYNLLK